MLVYRINPDGTPGAEIEMADGTTTIPADMTFSAPPIAAEGQFVVFDHVSRSWTITAAEPTGSAAPSLGSIITVLAFRQRFTLAEKTAIELASLDTPSGTLAERQPAAALRAYLGDLAVATFVDLARTDTISSVQQLEDFGVLAAGRAEDILTAPVIWAELPLSLQQSA